MHEEFETRSRGIMKLIDPKILREIKKNKLWVLRNRRDHAAINVAYSKDGLRWTTGATGKLLLSGLECNIEGFMATEEEHDGFYMEPFDPRNHDIPKLQALEYVACNKAIKLAYFI